MSMALGLLKEGRGFHVWEPRTWEADRLPAMTSTMAPATATLFK
jgi:hypothetical protein